MTTRERREKDDNDKNKTEERGKTTTREMRAKDDDKREESKR